MAKLYEVAKLVRSKNAGPFEITIDVIFPDHATYDMATATKELSAENITALYGFEPGHIKRYELPLANALKFSYPRSVPAGDFLDEDLYGCQQHRPFVNLEIPV